MLIIDDRRRWVTGNSAASELLGIGREEIPWHTVDDFMLPDDRRKIEDQWEPFLKAGTAEGWYRLHAPERGPMPIEFSATANVLPGRHLFVFIPKTSAERTSGGVPLEGAWRPIAAEESGRLPLTKREREILTLVASGLHTADVGERLFVSPETVKSHIHNAMEKLGTHTRAHAVAIALVTGEITWEIDDLPTLAVPSVDLPPLS